MPWVLEVFLAQSPVSVRSLLKKNPLGTQDKRKRVKKEPPLQRRHVSVNVQNKAIKYT